MVQKECYWFSTATRLSRIRVIADIVGEFGPKMPTLLANIDFLKRNMINTAIEVKSSDAVGRSDLSALRAIAEEGDFAHRIIVCREPFPRVENGVEILPYAEFIKLLWNDELIDLDMVS